MSDTNLILAAEKYAESYHDEDKTDVLNAFYHGAEFQIKNQGDTLTVSKLRPMSEAPKNGVFILAYNKNNQFEKVYFNSEDESWFLAHCDEFYNEINLLGYIPLPIYKPE